MNDLEISKQLALAIGWKKAEVFTWGVMVSQHDGMGWKNFDYRDWNVIGPIAEKFECFPIRTKTEEWFANIWDQNGFYADTPQKAIAMAVIAVAKK